MYTAITTASPVRVWDIRTWPPLYQAAAIWTVFLVALTVKTIVDPVKHSTYPDFQRGSRCWWAGEDVYDPVTGAAGFRYGPAFAVALGPLAMLPICQGELLWNWLNVGFFFWIMRLLVRRGLPGYWTPGREAVFLVLVLVAASRSVWAAQSNVLVFCLVALATIAIQDRRWWKAAALLAIPVHIKVWPVAAAGLLIACRPRALAGRFVAALVGIGLAPFCTGLPAWVWRQYAGWFSLLTGPAQDRHEYRDAWTLWEAVYAPVNPQLYITIQLATACAAILLCLRQIRRTADDRRLLVFVLAMWTVWQLVFGPATERNTFGLIAPLISWGLITSITEKREQWLMGMSFLLTLGASFGVIERWLEPHLQVATAAHPIGVLLFLVWFLRWNRSTGGPSQVATSPPATLS
jgi:hypothetical protein